jgi:hypothetical protein
MTLDGAPAVELVYASGCFSNVDTIEAMARGADGGGVYRFGRVATRSQDQATFHENIKALHVPRDLPSSKGSVVGGRTPRLPLWGFAA